MYIIFHSFKLSNVQLRLAVQILRENAIYLIINDDDFMILNGCSFSTVGLCTLIRVRKDTPQVISDKATAKIRDTIFRLGRLLQILYLDLFGWYCYCM